MAVPPSTIAANSKATPQYTGVAFSLAGNVAARMPAPDRQVAAPQALTADQRAELERWWDAQPKVNLPYDNDGAKILIVEFTDLQCPHCRQKYFEIKPMIDKYTARPKDLKFLVKHWPISSTCNRNVTANPHPAACDAAAAVVMARPKGTADKLIDWFFLHQDEMNADTVRRAATDVGKVTDFNAQFLRATQEVKTDVSLGAALGVNSTPTFFLNARRLPGGGLVPLYFDALIDLELKRAK
jgi:protein-disulfide isomerase